MNAITVGEGGKKSKTIVINYKINTNWVRLTGTHVCIVREHTHTESRTHIETVLLHFDRDLFGHTLCASCQPSSTAAI